MTIFTLMTYIGLVAAVISAVMIFVLKVQKSSIMTFIQNFCGVLFIFSGWVKAVDPMGTAIKMEDYFAEFNVTFADTAFSFIAPVFPFLASYSLWFAILMIILEIVLGIMLVLGDRPKTTSWLFFFIILFFLFLTGFTFLTGYVPLDQNFFSFSAWTDFKASNMRVTDCGCFGDFIKLDPRTSFYKDVFLMIPAIYFLWRYKDFHQLQTNKSRNIINLVSIIFLVIYCIYNFYWNEPHVDFRPFKNGANIAEIQKIEQDASKAVQVLAMKMKNKTTGEIKEFPYAEYMKNLGPITDEYETIEQIKTEPTIKSTKVSEFSITDFDGEEKSDLYLKNPESHLMVQIYKAKYEAVGKMKTIQDSTFNYDTISVVGFKDSTQVVKTFKGATAKEEKYYEIVWESDFINTLKTVIKPLYDAALKDKVKMSIVITGIDKDKAEALAKETGIDADYYTADEKLIKTIMRSNPGIVLWQNGVLLQKWHYKKLPQWEDIKKDYLKK